MCPNYDVLIDNCDPNSLPYLWSKYSKTYFNKVKVAFNNIYRHLFGIKLGASISASMVGNKVDCFKVLLRKYHFSFRNRLFKSDNCYVKIIATSFYFNHQSNLNKVWLSDLFNYM